MSNWKAVERNILQGYFDTTRNWQDQAMGGVDGYTDTEAVEIFMRDFPSYLLTELNQAERHARGKLPIVVWHEKHNAYKDDLVVLRLKDYLEITRGK